MNIFVTDVCPTISAYSLPKKLVQKMILEGYQMLSTAQRLAGNVDERLYKVTHKNHPCQIWCRTSAENYVWLYEHTKALAEVYEMYSGKTHASHKLLSEIVSKPPTSLLTGRLTRFARAMDDDIKTSVIDTQEAYQKYLNRKFQEWMTRDKPLKVEFVLDVPDWADDTTLKLMANMEK